MLESMPALIGKAEAAISDSGVSSATENLVAEAKKKYKNAASLSSGASADWLVIFTLLVGTKGLLDRAIKDAEDETDEADRRRRNHSSYASSSAWSSSGGSSSSSGGGFGGGSFGGGGASGSW